MNDRPPHSAFAVITAASSRLAFELATQFARQGFDLLVTSEDSSIDDLGVMLRRYGTAVQTVQADPAVPGDMHRLLSLLGRRPVQALVAHAGHGLDRALSHPGSAEPGPFVKAHLKGTVELIQALARRMRLQDAGRLLVLGPVGPERVGIRQALCGGTRHFITSFAADLRQECEGSGVSVTCCMPQLPDNQQDGPAREPDPVSVWAEAAFHALMNDEPQVQVTQGAAYRSAPAVPHWLTVRAGKEVRVGGRFR